MARVIHVMAPKDDGEGLEPDERACPVDEGDLAGVEVIYHPKAVLLARGGWACPVCGESSMPENVVH